MFCSHKYSLQDNDKIAARILFQEALEEMQLTKEDIHITMSLYTSTSQKKIAEVICETWKRAFGIDVQIETMEWSTYYAKILQKNFHIAAINWFASVKDPLQFLLPFKHLANPINVTQWHNPTFVKLLGEANITPNFTHRKQLLQQAESLLVEEVPIIPLFFNAPLFIQKKNLKGIVISDTGFIDFKSARFK